VSMAVFSYATGRPCTNLTTATMTASSNSTWMKPPIVYEVANPSTHNSNNMTAIVHNMRSSPSRTIVAVFLPMSFRGKVSRFPNCQ
jgi:hypothetical protein